MASDRLETLRSIPLFSGLPDASIERIVGLGAEADVPPGQVLIEAGREGSGLFVIEEGTVLIEKGGQVRECGPGQVVGELSLLTDEVRSARVQTKTPCRVLAISRAHFWKLLEEEPKLAVSMLRAVASRLAHATSL